MSRSSAEFLVRSVFSRPVRRACSVAFVAVVALSLAVLGVMWAILRSSLPQLEGQRRLPGLAAPVQIARDHQGVPTVQAATELDAMRGLGFLHAQERFFQMDLTRRKSAGTLAELVGASALASDREVRRHGFRTLAKTVWDRLAPADRQLLTIYTAGVNAGLQSLGG